MVHAKIVTEFMLQRPGGRRLDLRTWSPPICSKNPIQLQGAPAGRTKTLCWHKSTRTPRARAASSAALARLARPLPQRLGERDRIEDIGPGPEEGHRAVGDGSVARRDRILASKQGLRDAPALGPNRTKSRYFDGRDQNPALLDRGAVAAAAASRFAGADRNWAAAMKPATAKANKKQLKFRMS